MEETEKVSVEVTDARKHLDKLKSFDNRLASTLDFELNQLV